MYNLKIGLTMELSTNNNTINITGNIKSISDFQKIKSNTDVVVKEHKMINIKIIDSLSITSSVIGYFNKLVLKDNINIRMTIGNPQLMTLLEDLNLVSTFNASKV